MKVRLLTLAYYLAALVVTCHPALADVPLHRAATAASRSTSLRFEVTIAPSLGSGPQKGRLFVVLNKNNQPEPRLFIDRTGLEAAPVMGGDVAGLQPGVSA